MIRKGSILRFCARGQGGQGESLFPVQREGKVSGQDVYGSSGSHLCEIAKFPC